MASKVKKLPREHILKNFYKSSKATKASVMAIVDSLAGAELAAVDSNFAAGYPNEVSEEWYSKVDQHYSDLAKATNSEVAAVDDSDRLSMVTDSVNANAAFNRASLNKPLPALPHPYFEYLFADADKTSKCLNSRDGNLHIDPVKRDSDGFSVPSHPASYNSIDNLSFDSDGDNDMILDEAPSPPSPGPLTPPFHLTPPAAVDLSAFTQYVFHQANIPLTKKDIIDSSIFAIDTGLQGPTPGIYEQDLEKEQVTATLFNNIGAKENETTLFPCLVASDTSSNHTQQVQEYAYSQETTGSIREARLDILDRASLGFGQYAEAEEVQAPLVKPMLKPRSPKGKLQEKSDIKSLAAKWIKRRQGKGESTSISTAATYSINISLKRGARDSFATRSAGLANESVVYVGTKKIRKESPLPWSSDELQNPFNLSSPVYLRTPGYIKSHVSIYASHLTHSPLPIEGSHISREAGIFLPPATDAVPHSLDLIARPLSPSTPAVIVDLVTPETFSTIAELPTPLTASYKAFPGQFIGVALNLIAAKTKLGAMKRPGVNIFGDRLHPNGPIVHKNCYPAPTTPVWNYEPETLSRHSSLFKAFLDCDHYLELAASWPVASLRSSSEGALRREVHVELAAARLEGVCVGEYRYYQGHLSVEEYLSKGLCVCWSPCACSRVCSRYGDVMCPCGGDLELAGDSDSESEGDGEGGDGKIE